VIRLFSTPLALRLAWCLVHFLWQGTLLGLLAWGTLAALRGRSSRVRYSIACLFLVLCAMAPLITFLTLAPPVGATPAASAPLLVGFEPASLGTPLSLIPAKPMPWQARLAPWLPALLLVWMIGSLLLGLRALGGWLWLQHLRHGAEPILEGEWAKRVIELASRAGIRRTVRLLQSARIRTPMALGLLRPVVLVPLGFFAHVDVAGAEAVLAHELAHLRRLDPIVNGLQCLLETLLFFHPAIHFISRRVRTERECCCDDEAVMACGDVVLYVETLCRLDALRDRPLSLALSARGGNLMERITRMLAPTPAPRLTIPILTLTLCSLGATVLLAQAPKKTTSLPVAPSVVASPVASAIPARPTALATTLDPWGDKGERSPVQIEAKTLKEAIRKFAEARNLDPVIGGSIPDRDGPFVFRHAPWRAALESLVKSQGLACTIQDGVLRVAYWSEIQNEAERARQMAMSSEIPTPQPAPTSTPEAKPSVAATSITYLPPRQVKFTLRSGKDGAAKLRIEARRVSREELLEALRKIEHLAKSGLDGERPLQGEWSLPPMKDEAAHELHTFELDGVSTQSVRELYK